MNGVAENNRLEYACDQYAVWRKWEPSVSVRLWFTFFFNDTATTEIYTLSLHDALPISPTTKAKCASAGDDSRKANHNSVPDRKSTRLNSSHVEISYAVFCLKKKKE